MAMPVANTPWPPKAWEAAYAQYAENDAWLTGDTKTLTSLYGGQESATHTRAGQPHRGGIAGAASRLFWGRPVPSGEHRSRTHVPAPADLATLASDLQYSDPPVTSLTGDRTGDGLTQARLDLLMNSDEAHAMFVSQGEIKSALGATIILPRWDTEVEDHVWLDYAAADTAIPTFRHGRLTEVTLWSEWLDGHVYWRHLEHHAPGYIEHALFRGTATNLGQRRPLAVHPSTESYAKLVDAESRIPTLVDRLTAGYLPNAPALSWRRSGVIKDAGRSDFNQCLPLFDALDEAFSSWMRDLKLGAAKLIVPETYLKSNGPGAGASFDLFREMFVGMNLPGKAGDGLDLSAHQFKIRVDEHEKTMRGIMREILRKAGFSPSSWGDPDQSGGQATATEIQARTEQTERTRSRKNLHDRRVLARMGSVALELDGILFPGKGGGRHDLTVVFPELSRTDPKTEAETIGLLKVAGAISTETRCDARTPIGTTPRSPKRHNTLRAHRRPISQLTSSSSTASTTKEQPVQTCDSSDPATPASPRSVDVGPRSRDDTYHQGLLPSHTSTSFQKGLSACPMTRSPRSSRSQCRSILPSRTTELAASLRPALSPQLSPQVASRREDPRRKD